MARRARSATGTDPDCHRARAAGRHRQSPIGFAKCPACFWPGCTGQNALSLSGCCGWQTAPCLGRRSNSDKALPWTEKRIGLVLAESQITAIRLALVSKVLVMTGGPGVGKTTIVRAILRILAAKGTSLLLCAPTGRAAKRMNRDDWILGQDHPPAARGRSQKRWL